MTSSIIKVINYDVIGGPYMTSRVGEAKNFLDEVRSQFKAGNLMLYEQAVKNLEKFYEVTAEKEIGSFQTFGSRQ